MRPVSPAAPQVIKELTGTYDPNESQTMQPQLVDANATASPDGRYALIGWSRRDGANGWEIGADVLDLATGQVTGTQAITLDEPVSADGSPRTRIAPVASVSPDGSTILLSSFWYVEEPDTSTPSAGTDHWTAMFADGVIGRARPSRVSRRPARPRVPTAANSMPARSTRAATTRSAGRRSDGSRSRESASTAPRSIRRSCRATRTRQARC